MPFPKRLARFNRVVTNPVVRRVAGWLPGFAILDHVGRRSGRTYRTPVNMFRTGDDRYVVALTYGRDSDWVRNTLAAGGCEAQTRGRHVHLTEPEIVHDDQRALMPVPVRNVLGLADVSDFMVLRGPASPAGR
jgi:deazaflavin-dependent oxidoreductase (nitroreductase family)